MPLRWPISAPATVTLAGLRIDRAERTPAALHDQLIPWHQVASLRDTLALPLDARGRPLRHDGRRVSLKLRSRRAGRLADRALRRAIARAFNDGSITIRGDWSTAVWGEVAGIAFMTSAVIALFVLAAIGLLDLARALTGSPDAMVSLGVLVVVLGGVVLWSYVSIVLVMLRQMSTLRLYADARGIRLVQLRGRRCRIAWSDVRHIDSTGVLRLHAGGRIRAPSPHIAFRALLDCVRRSMGIYPSLKATAAFWFVVAVILPALCAISLWWNARSNLLPDHPPQSIIAVAIVPAAIAAFFLGLLAWADLRARRRVAASLRNTAHTDTDAPTDLGL